MKGDFRVDERSAMWNLPRWERGFHPSNEAPISVFLGMGSDCLFICSSYSPTALLETVFQGGLSFSFFLFEVFHVYEASGLSH